MKKLLRNFRARIESVLLARARAATRRRLLAMPDRNLADIGISRDLLELGVAAWPWRLGGTPAAPGELVTAAQRRQAIRELRALSDRELDDLGLSRADIAAAVNHGRLGIEIPGERRVA